MGAIIIRLMICNFTLKMNQILYNSILYFSFGIVFLVFVFKEPPLIRHFFVSRKEIKYLSRYGVKKNLRFTGINGVYAVEVRIVY